MRYSAYPAYNFNQVWTVCAIGIIFFYSLAYFSAKILGATCFADFVPAVFPLTFPEFRVSELILHETGQVAIDLFKFKCT